MPRNLVPAARRLRRGGSEAEHALWCYLRDRQFDGLKFRRQHPLAGYVLDFYCEELKLCIELDGGQHATQIAKDTTRTAALNELGVTVVRFWNDEVLNKQDGVWQRLQRVIADLRSTNPRSMERGQ